MIHRFPWIDLEEIEKQELLEHLQVRTNESSSTSVTMKMRSSVLAFYRGVRLIEVNDLFAEGPQEKSWYFYYQDSLVHLDGTSAPIHDMNDLVRINLTTETVAEYVRFFCFFVHGDDGPFFVLEDIDSPVIDKKRNDFHKMKTIKDLCKPLEIITITHEGFFIVSGNVLYGNDLFGVKFVVSSNGVIQIIDEELYLEGISVLHNY
jgi:hypothetical protein